MIPFQTDDYDNPGFVERVNEVVFPDLQPENLVLPHRNYIINGLILAQTHIPCLKESNVSFFTKADMQDNCNVSIIHSAPRGNIHGVFAFKPCKGCTKQRYEQKSTSFIMRYADQWASCSCASENDICNARMNGDQKCLPPYTPDGVENDSTFLCSPKNFAYGVKNKLYLAPRSPCGYIVGILWEGIKREYSNVDLVTDDNDVIDLIAVYLEGERFLRIDRDIERWREIMRQPRPEMRDSGGVFWQKLAQVAHRCREERRIRQTILNEDICDESALAHFNVSALDPLPQLPDDYCYWDGYGYLDPNYGGPGEPGGPYYGSCREDQWKLNGECQECVAPTVEITASKQSITLHQAITIGYNSTTINQSDSIVTIEWDDNLIQVVRNTSGTFSFFPLVNTVYKIKAVTFCGTVEATVFVQVNAFPEGCSCPADDVEERGAFIADWGDAFTSFVNSKAVVLAIEAFDPTLVMTGGDNRYGAVGETPPNATYETLLSEHPFFSDIFFGGLPGKEIFFGIGNHDITDGLGIDEFLGMFPDNGGARNFSVKRGLFEYFFRETHDSVTITPEDLAASATWLQGALAASTARWKIVVTQDPPWTSSDGNSPGHVQSQLPYAEWGADLVLSGDSHNYERFYREGINSIVCGSGGKTLDTGFTNVQEGSLFRNDTDYGFVALTANNNRLLAQFVNKESDVLDVLTIDKPCCVRIADYVDGVTIEQCVDGEPSALPVWDGVMSCAGVCSWGFAHGQYSMAGLDVAVFIIISGCELVNVYELNIVTRNLDGTFNIAWQGSSVGSSIGVYTRTLGCGPETLTIESCYECVPPSAVTADPPNGSTVVSNTFVSLHGDDTAVIFYTLDGTEPTNASTLYTGPFNLPEGVLVIKAISYSNSCSGPVNTITYELSDLFQFSYHCLQDVDYVGEFYEFAPNAVFGEYVWGLRYLLPDGGDVKRIEIYETNTVGKWVTGQAWATDNPVTPDETGNPFSIYPIVIYEDGVQLVSEYKTTLLPAAGTAERVWTMFGQPFVPLTGYFKIKFTYVVDGDEKTIYSIITNECYYYY